jgi:hypothetical protein
MATGIKARLEKLEGVLNPEGRLIVMWGSTDKTPEEIKEQARAERGMKEGDRLIIVGWMRSEEDARAVNEARAAYLGRHHSSDEGMLQ